MSEINKFFIVFSFGLFLIIGTISLTAFILRDEIHKSYLSVKVACSCDDVLEGTSYYVAGNFNVKQLENGSIETTIQLDERADDSTLRHEKCHEKQYLEGRLKTCNNKIGKFFNELECYLKQ